MLFSGSLVHISPPLTAQGLSGVRARRSPWGVRPFPIARGLHPVADSARTARAALLTLSSHDTSDLLASPQFTQHGGPAGHRLGLHSMNPRPRLLSSRRRILAATCPLLTSALRWGCLSASSVPTPGQQRRSPGVSSITFAAYPPDIHAQGLDGYGLCVPTHARPPRPASYPIPVRQVAALHHASFRPSLARCALARC